MGVKIQKPGDPGHPGGTRRIYVRINFRGQRRTCVFNTTKGATDFAAQVEAHLKLGNVAAVFADSAPKPEPVPAPAFQEAAERWLAVDGAAWEGNTIEVYRNVVRKHLLPTLGARPLDAITPADVESWWAELCRHGYSREHLGNIRAALAGTFRRAMATGLIARNPADAIRGRMGRAAGEVRQMEWLTEAELRRALEAAEAREPRWFPLLLTLASSGLRLGEALGLQVGDVDVTRGKLLVRRAVRKVHIGSPKSGKARTADVPPATVTVLRDWLETVRAEAVVQGREALWLFPSRTGHLLSEHHVRTAFRRCLTAARITRRIRLHDLRHTYASLALQRGVPLLVVSRQLGQASIAITADTYGHLAPDATREAAAAWEAILTAPIRNPGATPAPDPA